jgi:NAD(P)H-hydrate epimerase
MHVVTAAEMRQLDEIAINRLGIPGIVLMENAGREIAREAIDLYNSLYNSEMPAAEQKKPSWLILVGKGNNGGDGLVAARHFAEAGHEVAILYAVPPEQLRGDAARQRDIAASWGLRSFVYGQEPVAWHCYGGIIDALLGTGSKGQPRDPYASIIREANASGLPIIAADIPSGLNADTGEVAGDCIRAKRTVSLAFAKRGLMQYPGAAYAGEVVVKPIGIPAFLADDHGVRTFLLQDDVFRQRLRLDPRLPRRADTHKGTYGHVLVVAGTRRFSGAGLLCATAALRAGSGLVTWALPESLLPFMLGKRPEIMLTGIADSGQGDWSQTVPDEILRLAQDKEAAVVGPGLGRFAGDVQWLRRLWEESSCPLVVDADALNIIADAEDFSAWTHKDVPVIITPHPGEMARLCKLSTAEVQRNRLELARSFAAIHHVTVVLKGARTVIAAPDGEAFINTTGNPGMATGGSGDVLAGIAAGLLAQGLSGKQAACLAVYLHGLAGDRAAERRPSPYSLIAGDIAEEL